MSEFSQNLAVVVGINLYAGGISPLRTAVSDVKAIAHQLQQNHRYQVISLIDQQATLENLQRLLTETLPKQITPNSRLLFYFAGHGIALNGDDGPEGYLIPQDAKLGDTSRYLSMPVLQSALTELPCRHFLGILDCCFAGAFRWSSTRDIGFVPEVIHKERYDRFIQDPAWQIITSAAYDQRALDSLSIEESHRGQVGNHSPFAAAMLEALSGKADLYPPAKNGVPAGDGVITATELYLYLRERVEPVTEQKAQRQTPGIWPLQKHDKGEYIFLSPGHTLNLPPAPALDKLNNPYRGLNAFEPSDSDLFFGRQKLSHQLCQTVHEQPLTVVLGASGSGKSSLVKAGLIPMLIQSEHNEVSANKLANRWQILPILRLGSDPAAALQRILDEQAGTYNTLAGYLNACSRLSSGKRVVLVIDQFEELITLCDSESQRESFLALLIQAIASYPNQLRIVLTLRSDFEPQFQDSVLQPYWNNARFIVTPMTRSDLRAAIVQPAAARVIYFQSDSAEHPLVDQLIDEVAGMPGALPLLSFTLSELYLKYLKRQNKAKRKGRIIERTITEADYRELGGVARSLTQRANEEYDTLVTREPNYALTIRNVMLRMVAVGGGQIARRSVPLKEFEYPFPENQRVNTVINQFTAARLLVEGTGADGEAYVEPAHDALILGWQRLLTWQQAEEAELILQRRLTPAAQEWRSQSKHQAANSLQTKAEPLLNILDSGFYAVENRTSDLLKKGSQLWRKGQTDHIQTASAQFLWDTSPYLDAFQQALDVDSHRLNKLETAFVRESVLRRRQNTSWRWRIAIATILGLSGLLLAALTGRRADLIGQIKTSRNAAEVNLRAGQPLDALNDSLIAAQTFGHPLLQIFQPNEQLRSQVKGTLQKMVYSTPERNRMTAHQGTVRSDASSNGQVIASAGGDGTVALWNWQGQKQAEWTTHQGQVFSIRISPDGETVATGGEDGSVRLWNLQGQLIANLEGHSATVRGISFSPNGRLLATSGLDATIRLWDLRQKRANAVITGHKQDVWSVEFSPDGRQLASASDDGTFRLWNLKGRQLNAFDAQLGNLHVIRFSPDGNRLAAAGEDGRIRLWSTGGRLLTTLEGHEGRVWGLNFNSIGQLGSSSGDGTVRLWSEEGEILKTMESHQGPVRTISFSPDGEQSVTSGDDGTVRLWNFQSLQSVALNEIEKSPVNAIALNSNSQNVVTSAQDQTIRLWTEQGKLIKSLTELSSVGALALSRDGKKVAIARGKDILLKNLQGRQLSKHEGSSGNVRSLQLSANDQLVSAQDDGSVHLWDTTTKDATNWIADSSGLWSVAISPNRQQIATAGEDGIIRLWDLEGSLINQLEGHLGAVRSVAFSPNGNQVASGGEDGTVRLWDVRNKQEHKIFQVFGADINSVSFSPVGTLLSSGDSAGNVQLWDLSSGESFASWQAHPGVAIRDIEIGEKAVITLAENGKAYIWSLEDFEQLQERGCQLIKNYLNQTEDNRERSRDICR